MVDERLDLRFLTAPVSDATSKRDILGRSTKVEHLKRVKFLTIGLALTACTPKEPPAVAAASAETNPPVERAGLIHANDEALTLWGPAASVGNMAPVGTLRDNENRPVTLNFADGKIQAVLFAPSLDTPTCSQEAQTFNSRASHINDDVEILLVSRDLPAAQKRFCGAQSIDRMVTLSDFDDGSFGESWGLLVKETRLLGRAVGVVDGAGRIAYLEIVENIAEEPDYDAAIAALAKLAPPPPLAPEEDDETPEEAEAE